MQPLDRYLKDLKSHLPGDQADDIASELAENLRAQFEDREAELGRPLTDAEQQAILKAHGNPLVVASRYRKEQMSFTFGRQLIGPALFPAYLQVLTINIAISVFVVLVAAVLLATGQAPRLDALEPGACIRDPVRGRHRHLRRRRPDDHG